MTVREPETLPGWLREQSLRRPHAIALRHKRRGAWHARTWAQTAEIVARLAANLAQRGARPGEAVALVSEPGESALLFSLAVQWAGAVALLIDPGLDDDALAAVIAHRAPRFAFAGDDRQLDRLRAQGLQVVDANERALAAHDAPDVIDFHVFSGTDAARFDPLAVSGGEAFVLLRAEQPGQLVERRFTHGALLQDARLVIETGAIDARDEAFAARAFAAPAQARYLIAPWLLAGFRLNFPESLATRDNDRRELAPTLVAGTHETYARLAGLVEARLPGPGAWRRKRLARAAAGKGLGYLLSAWLVARPLREVIGFARTRVALLAGPPLDEASAVLFASLGIDVRVWPEAGPWHRLTFAAPEALAAEAELDTPLGPALGQAV
jgi:long-chain acyl-CoA synthetase